MRGNTDFKGAILVLGKGELIRNGGGNGDILGGITVAAFGRQSGNFTAPTFHTNGGGNSNYPIRLSVVEKRHRLRHQCLRHPRILTFLTPRAATDYTDKSM